MHVCARLMAQPLQRVEHAVALHRARASLRLAAQRGRITLAETAGPKRVWESNSALGRRHLQAACWRTRAPLPAAHTGVCYYTPELVLWP